MENTIQDYGTTYQNYKPNKMNAKNLLTFQAVVGILFGVALILMPKTLLQPYLNNPTDLNLEGQLLGSLYGATLMGIGIGCWIARNGKTPKSWLYGIMISNAFHLYVYAREAQSGVLNSLNWSSIILVSVIALWAAYLLFIKKTNQNEN